MDMIPTETMSVKTGARLLETLTSALYADPIVVFREYVQNAIDSFRVSTQQRDFRIDIILVPGKRKIIIRDNGDGIPSDKFEEKMMSLGSSEKTENQIGFRGIGRLAGLSFCDKLCFKNRANQKNPSQSFVLEGKKYRSILTELNSGSLSLNIVMNRIKSTDKPSDVDEGDWSFEVSLDGVTDELMDCIYSSKPKRGKAGRQPEVNNELLSSDSLPTEDFVNALSMLLPVPYSKEFTRRSEIVQQYQKWFGTELSAREFKIFLNGVQLFKPFSADEQMDFRIIPLYINDLRETANDRSQESKIVGLLWMSFDYVFKAVKKKFGIAVRSKNMLVRGGAVLAEEAANSRDAITTYGQYLSAIKGVTGELLLETDCLSDNSRRDWFKVDKNSLQLRDQLCYLMNRM
ncbi:ATP-binding protein, partial [Breznakiellaceae bacterium SP9]